MLTLLNLIAVNHRCIKVHQGPLVDALRSAKETRGP